VIGLNETEPNPKQGLTRDKSKTAVGLAQSRERKMARSEGKGETMFRKGRPTKKSWIRGGRVSAPRGKGRRKLVKTVPQKETVGEVGERGG